MPVIYSDTHQCLTRLQRDIEYSVDYFAGRKAMDIYMGKFDGILLCTDLDDTLLTTDKRVSEENKRAIEYFKKEGGTFTFATGRVVHGAKLALDYITPNAPMVCFNGGGIYDFQRNKMLWSLYLDDEAVKVVELVDRQFPSAGIEICTDDTVYVSKMNKIVHEHLVFEKLPEEFADYHNIPETWKKVLFMVEENELPALKELIQNSEFVDKYNFIQSSPNYYELLPIGSDKGSGLLKLAELLRMDPKRTVAIGDNENDVSLIQNAGIGVAVANAISEAHQVADYITVDNNSHALSTIIRAINDGKIKV
jgi:hypothetical protein